MVNQGFKPGWYEFIRSESTIGIQGVELNCPSSSIIGVIDKIRLGYSLIYFIEDQLAYTPGVSEYDFTNDVLTVYTNTHVFVFKHLSEEEVDKGIGG